VLAETVCSVPTLSCRPSRRLAILRVGRGVDSLSVAVGVVVVIAELLSALGLWTLLCLYDRRHGVLSAQIDGSDAYEEQRRQYQNSAH
jgi:hypothetical protein